MGFKEDLLKKRAAYSKKCLADSYKYEKDVLSGKIVACNWIKLAIKRRQEVVDKKYFFDKEEVLRFFDFLFYIKITIDGEVSQFKPSPWQSWIIMNSFGYFRDKDFSKRLYRFVNIWVARKSGKALSLDTKIPTPSGWTTMGDLSVGDFVLSQDGTPTTVEYISETNSTRPMYEVTFEDGEKIKACEDHQWEVETRHSRRRVKDGKKASVDFEDGYLKNGFVLTTKDMANDFTSVGKKGNNYKYRVPINKPLELPEKDLLIDPYLLGCWLGDGSSYGPNIYCHIDDLHNFAFMKDMKYGYREIPDCRNANVIDIALTNGEVKLKHQLRDLNLIKNKHIPHEYLRASYEQRLSLLQGLMDTDGYVCKRGECSIVQKSKNLIDNIGELLSSLGIKWKLHPVKKGCNGVVGQYYNILFFTDKNRPCFKFKRKFDRLKDKLSPRMRNKSIIDIKPILSEPMRCITVAHKSSLFLAGEHMTTTHNTMLSALFSMYALIKGERNAEVYFCAPTKRQATQALKYLKQVVDDSPALKVGKGKVIKREFKLRYEQNGSCTAEALANEPERLDGLHPSFAIIDEKHALPDNKLFNIIKTGTVTRKNPMIVTISTAGFNLDYPFYNEIEVGKRVLNGEVEDESTFYAFYTLDDESEIDNPKMWIKSNPALGTVVDEEVLQIEYDKSKLSVSDKKNFITKNLNVFVDGEDEWIPDVNYKKCFNEVDIESLRGCKAYMGLDLSNSRDLSSLVIVIENPETGKIEVIPEFYFPSGSGEKRVRASGIDLTGWIEKDFILEHDGNIIDYDRIFDRINFYCDFFDVQGIGYDPWNAVLLINKIQEEIFVDVKACRQNTGFFNFPLKFIERLIFSEKINLSKNPCLRWNFRNVVIWQDGNDNIKIVKNKSKDSVDGAVALGMAVGIYCEMNYDAMATLMESINKTSNG